MSKLFSHLFIAIHQHLHFFSVTRMTVLNVCQSARREFEYNFWLRRKKLNNQVVKSSNTMMPPWGGGKKMSKFQTDWCN